LCPETTFAQWPLDGFGTSSSRHASDRATLEAPDRCATFSAGAAQTSS
jgi:hypothetical protein